MTVTQLSVVALIAVAFVAGWLLRGESSSSDHDVRGAEPGGATAALEAAWASYLKARTGDPAQLRMLNQALSEADDHGERLLGDVAEREARASSYDRALAALEGLARLLAQDGSGSAREEQLLRDLASARTAWRTAEAAGSQARPRARPDLR